MRVAFFGTSAFAVPSLERLAGSRHPVVLCVTQPDKPRGRGLSLEPSPVKQAAVRLKLPLIQPERVSAKDFNCAVDVGVVASYGQLIRRDLLSLPPHGILGIHPSLLPKYRGAAPIARAILQGEKQTGVTIFRLNEALDAGEVISRKTVSIEPEENTQQLTERLAKLSADELLLALDAVEQGKAAYAPQDNAQATFAPKFTKTDGQIDWSKPAEAIARQVRALYPWPGAATLWQNNPVRVWSASALPASANEPLPAGCIRRVSQEGIVVGAGQGGVLITQLQLSGGRRLSVKEFLAGHSVKVGDRFGNA